VLLDLHSVFELFKDPLHPMDIAYLTRKLEENAAGIGSCVVVRKDGQPLNHKLMYALETYGTLHTQQAARDPEFRGSVDEILAKVTKEDWENFCSEFLKRLPEWV
jgi:hypothetical protein